MKSITINQAARTAAAALLAVAVVLPAAAYAQGPPEDRGRPANITEKIEERRAQALQRLEEKRTNSQEKSQEKRKAACERRASKLDKHTNRLALRSDRHADVMDRFFERVQEFYDKGQLTVSNYDELEAAAVEAQEKARAEVDTLEGLKVEVDCNDPDVAATVIAFRTSTESARESLKDYRRALVELISSMRAAAAEENAGSENGEFETESETENIGQEETNLESGSENETETEGGTQ